MPASTSGLFTADSVTWAVHADPAMWVAGVRALYLQALHPRVVRGVMQHSHFRQDPLGRLYRTARFVKITTYASADSARRLAARVRRIHATLQAVDPASGRSYPLDEPDLLRWVHCAATVSYVDVVRRAGLRLTDEEVDRYVDEQRLSAQLVGLDPQTVPGDRAALEQYFDEVRPELAASPDAEDIYTFLTDPPMPPQFTRLFSPFGRLGSTAYSLGSRHGWRRLSRVAYSALPAWAVDLYGHESYSNTATTTALRVLRDSARLVPKGVRARLVSG